MANPITARMSFVHGAVREPDLAYVTMVIDEFSEQRTPHGVLLQWDGGVFQKIAGVPWNIVGVDVLRTPHPGVIAVGETGQAVIAGPGVLQMEDMAPVERETGMIVPLRAVRCIGSNTYATGMRRQVYSRSPQGTWGPVHGGMLVPVAAPTIHGFEAIAGFEEREIYAAGWEGEIWRFDGKAWTQLDSPTNLVLSGLCCGADGLVYACGQGGVIVRGRHDSWEVIPSNGIQDDLWSILSFKERIFIAGFRLLLELTDGGLRVVPEATSIADEFFSLSTDGRVLWSVAPKTILSFDGTNWLRIV
ncbi:MAG: hypothetical protein KBD01_11820 [Acidobacteria bacterium]|nr:hypothetical protein [Acidobacteriota bacterium]